MYTTIQQAAELAHQAYRDHQETNRQWSGRINRQLGCRAHVVDDAAWITRDTDTDLWIAIRGSDSLYDFWRYNLQVCDIRPWVTWPTASVTIGVGRITRRIFRRLANQILAAQREERAIHLTGHSLGGAIAQALAGYCVDNQLHVTSLTTFGSPAIGNHAFVHMIGESIADMRNLRCVATTDPVPQVCFWKHHVGKRIYFDHEGAVRVGDSLRWIMADRVKHFLKTLRIIRSHSMAAYRDLVNENIGEPYGD